MVDTEPKYSSVQIQSPEIREASQSTDPNALPSLKNLEAVPFLPKDQSGPLSPQEQDLSNSKGQSTTGETVLDVHTPNDQNNSGHHDQDDQSGHNQPLDKTASALTLQKDNLSVYGTAPLYEVLSAKEQKLILYSVYCARFLAVLDATIVAVTLPSILKDLGGQQYLSWLIASYLLSDSVTLPLSGRLSDIYGRKKIYLWSLGIFLTGSILCGAATDIWFLVVSRFLQGIGGGGLTGMTMIIPGDIIAPKDRPHIFAYLGIIAGLGALLGPIIGGGLTDAYSWRLVFYINVPPGIFSAWLAVVSMKHFEVPTKKLELDYLGSILIAISTICLVLFVTWGGEETIGYPWNSPQIIFLIILFAVTLVLFIAQEYRHPLPTLQLRLHKIKNVWMNFLIVFFAYYSMISVVNYFAVYFQNTLGDKAVISGLKLGGFVLGFIGMSRFSGKLLMKTRKSNIIMGLCGGLTALGLGLCSLLTPTLNYGYVFLFTTITGIGVGYLIPATGAIIQLSVPQRDIAVGMANFSFDSYIGGCIGVTVSGTIFTRTFQKYIKEGYSFEEATSKGVSQVFLWTVPPLVFASLIGFFIDPVKKKPSPLPGQATGLDKQSSTMTATTETHGTTKSTTQASIELQPHRNSA